MAAAVIRHPSSVALRTSSGVRYIFGDHLGSTSITAEGSGNNPIRQLYKAWGEVRYSSGSLPTKYAYTGQYSYAGEIGLLYYVARFYDPVLGRFSSPDSIIPIESQGVQAWDRFAYVNNSPLNFIDPTGHGCEDLPAGPREACINAREKIEDAKKSSIVSEFGASRNNQKIEELGTIATILDSLAAGYNGTYVIVGDTISVFCLQCTPYVFSLYRIFSVIPNSISSFAGGLWIIQGFYTGENSISINIVEPKIDVSISQDSIVAITTNVIGWLNPEPHSATVLDGLVVLYDFGRSGMDGIFDQIIPTLINPYFYYQRNSEIKLGWIK